MDFCNVCDNMLYLKIDGEDNNNLSYFCRKCGETVSMGNENNMGEKHCISKTYIKQPSQHMYPINQYTKYDTTLPRKKEIKCPKAKCPIHSNPKADDIYNVIYIRYDDKNMKFVYLCTECDRIWKNTD